MSETNCGHTTIERATTYRSDGTASEEWLCKDCLLNFVQAPGLQADVLRTMLRQAESALAERTRERDEAREMLEDMRKDNEDLITRYGFGRLAQAKSDAAACAEWIMEQELRPDVQHDSDFERSCAAARRVLAWAGEAKEEKDGA